MSSGVLLGDRISRWLDAPQPVLRLELVRIFAPLAILGFLSSRVAHADEWLGAAGFRVPDLAMSDHHQPVYVPPLPSWGAWLVCAALVGSGLAVSAGLRARQAAVIFAMAAVFVALSDRLAAFSVSKMAPAIGFALAASPCGRRLGVDAWLRKRRRPDAKLATSVRSGAVRFFQVLLPTIYCASGIAKARGDWLATPYVLWTHLHDTYQTAITILVGNALPTFAWPVLQGVVLGFEMLAPLWFVLRRTRTPAVVVAVSMHVGIGLMFGPVRWFAMLMATLVVASFVPERILDRLAARFTAA